MHDAELMRALTLGHSFCKHSPSEAFFEYQRHDDEIAQGVAPRYRMAPLWSATRHRDGRCLGRIAIMQQRPRGSDPSIRRT
jgi:hypothetical protein